MLILLCLWLSWNSGLNSFACPLADQCEGLSSGFGNCFFYALFELLGWHVWYAHLVFLKDERILAEWWHCFYVWKCALNWSLRAVQSTSGCLVRCWQPSSSAKWDPRTSVPRWVLGSSKSNWYLDSTWTFMGKKWKNYGHLSGCYCSPTFCNIGQLSLHLFCPYRPFCFLVSLGWHVHGNAAMLWTFFNRIHWQRQLEPRF